MSSATLLDAIADIRAAAQQSATLGANWYLLSDLTVLSPEDAALLVACEPVRLLQVLNAAERALQAPAAREIPPGYHVTVGRVGVLLSCVDRAGKIAKTQAFTSGNVDRDYLDAVEDGEAFLASLRDAEEINGANTATSEEALVVGISPSQSPSYTKATLHMLGLCCVHSDGLRFIFSVKTEAGDIVRLDLPFSALCEMLNSGVESLGYLIARHSDKSSGNPSRDGSPQEGQSV